MVGNPKNGNMKNDIEKAKGNPEKWSGDKPEYGAHKYIKRRKHAGADNERAYLRIEDKAAEVDRRKVKNCSIDSYFCKEFKEDIHTILS